MTPSIKITCIIHSLTIGGMERVMANLLNSFADRDNVEVTLLLIGRFRTVDFDISDKVQIYIPDFEFKPNQRFLSTLKTIQFIRKNIQEINPNTVLSFGEYWNNMVLMSLRGMKHPVFISDRSQPNKSLGKIQNLLRDKLYPKAAGYIAQTEEAKEIAHKNKWNKNTTVIGNPINHILKPINLDKENIVLTVGRLISTKHIDELIEIFREINDENWKLVIVGGNAKNLNLLDEYKELIKTLGLEHYIELVGAKSNVSDYYKKAKIFAFTSSSEGFPNVIGEAMSYGLPVIAYDCTAGPSDLINDGETGFLIEERDQKKYIENLKKLMQEEQLRNIQSSKALEKIKDFDAEKIAEQFFTFITK
jgi:GalNAc-alpha-(1->4)-GalNAc-alpha-(1->3)-diNAcBac-PP-undecaprenol alpha-1,4-N-acetyl-D-galactosaminyltransferase